MMDGKMKAERFLSKLNIEKGQTILITGGNSGIGKEEARMLCKCGCRVILACRRVEAGNEAKREFEMEMPGCKVQVIHLDLTSFESMDEFIEEVQKLDLDAIHFNAGIYRVPFTKGICDFESHMAVNFAANYYILDRLLPHLESLPHPVKVLFTTSVVARYYRIAPICYDGGKRYKKERSYAYSKTALNMVYLTLLKRSKSTNIIPILVHPGICFTPLIEKAYPNKRFRLLASKFIRFFFNSPKKGALPALLALSEATKSPCLLGPRGLFHSAGIPKSYPLYRGNLKNAEEMLLVARERFAKQGIEIKLN